MDAARWRRIEELTQAVLELPAAQRGAWLAARCADDEALLAEVASLLEAGEECANFLSRPAVSKAARLLSWEAERGARAGDRIGPYTILSEVGRGGMGVVYLAARDEEGFSRRVAIKLVRRGLDTDDILLRFRNERRILASLSHPNIASLFDGGTTEEGQPYFVMEYVEGHTLTRYCDERGLTKDERLRLFLKVCAAVQHAHQHLVVHRDLKPSNVLVNDSGEVKLLDFGVAKLLAPDETGEGPERTRPALRLMTPEYASPEQVRGRQVTTATDIYSLGVILYELLAGARPYRLEGFSGREVERAICDAEPPRPSQAAAGRVAAAQSLRGDMDNVVLKALRKEPAERYGSAEQLAEDIRRHLAGLPVSARDLTFAYRAAKFVRRNKVGAAAAAAVLLAVLSGLTVSVWQAQVAQRERNQARQERARADEIKNFLARTLNYSNPVLSQKSGRETPVAEMLDEAALRLEAGEFAGQPEVRAELEQIIGRAYLAQGKNHLADEHLQKYVTLQRQLYGEQHPKTLVALAGRAELLFYRGDFAEAETLYRQILPRLREGRREGTVGAGSLGGALNNFGYLRRTQGDSREAEAAFREALALSPLMSPEEWRDVNGTTRSTLASTLADQGRFAEALETAREAVNDFRGSGETKTPNYGFALTVLSGFLTEEGETREADAGLLEAEAIFRKFLAPSSLWLGDNLRNQALSLYEQGRYAEAQGKADETLRIYDDNIGPHYDHYPTALIVKGLSMARVGRAAEGEKIVRAAVRLRADSLPPQHYWVALANGALGECLTIEGRYGEAEPILRESFETLSNSQGSTNPRTRLALKRLVALYERWQKRDLAAEYGHLLVEK